jgi:hypothetical protein
VDTDLCGGNGDLDDAMAEPADARRAVTRLTRIRRVSVTLAGDPEGRQTNRP